jgi:sister-chromatid-cohesion protein PDS5
MQRSLLSRCQQIVRTQALNSIGKLYSLAYAEIENNDRAAIKQFAWIPDEIIQTTSANIEIRTLVEQVLADYVIPLPSLTTSSATKEKEVDEVAWTDRLLNVMRYLSEKSVQLLIGLSGLKSLCVVDFQCFIHLTSLQSRPNIFDIYLESCIKNNVRETLEPRNFYSAQFLSIGRYHR